MEETSTLSTQSAIITAAAKAKSMVSWESIKTPFYLGMWFILSAQYNTYNKLALKAVTPQPAATIAVSQLGVGFLIFMPLWLLGLREKPTEWKNFPKLIGKYKEVSAFQAITHLAGVIALGAGAVSFTQVVKASEPIFGAALMAICFGKFLPIPVYLSLIPVMAGVCIASVSQLDFTWYCLAAGIVSNTFAAARSAFSKEKMKATPGEKKMSPENVYALLTMISFFMTLPVALLWEPTGYASMLNNAQCWQNMVKSGLLFYLYNEFSFKALDCFTGESAAVSHALSNTMKRIVILVWSSLSLGESMSRSGKIGAALAIGGVYLYSMMKIKYGDAKPREKSN